MIKEYDSERDLSKNLKYWSSCNGEVFDPSDPFTLIPEEEWPEKLPSQLLSAYHSLWSRVGYDMDCYLAEYNGKYKIALVAACTIVWDEFCSCRSKIADYLTKRAMSYQKKPEFWNADILILDDTPKDICEMIILVPWDSEKSDVLKIAETVNNNIYQIDDYVNGPWLCLITRRDCYDGAGETHTIAAIEGAFQDEVKNAAKSRFREIVENDPDFSLLLPDAKPLPEAYREYAECAEQYNGYKNELTDDFVFISNGMHGTDTDYAQMYVEDPMRVTVV